VATVTERFIEIKGAYLELSYDDVTLNLISLSVVVGPRPVTVVIYKPNGTEWRRDVLAANTNELITFPIGPINNMSDIPGLALAAM